MRNFSLSLMLVMFVALFTTSCTEEDDYWSPIEGCWAIVDPPGADYNEYCFNHDGTGSYFISDYAGQSTYYFTWETFDNTLYVYFATGDTWRFTWYIRGAYLYLYPVGSGVPYVYEAF
ncbi:MAG: hypothetical protein K2L55_03315 [Muribaculaceae bacterium]|nr:hypothetical protein [Muribaculaceae bacterium]MDE6345681.1 hypothetical protein [Muribaculaceae bacterium]